MVRLDADFFALGDGEEIPEHLKALFPEKGKTTMERFLTVGIHCTECDASHVLYTGPIIDIVTETFDTMSKLINTCFQCNGVSDTNPIEVFVSFTSTPTTIINNCRVITQD